MELERQLMTFVAHLSKRLSNIQTISIGVMLVGTPCWGLVLTVTDLALIHRAQAVLIAAANTCSFASACVAIAVAPSDLAN